jgi:hypothetical protein
MTGLIATGCLALAVHGSQVCYTGDKITCADPLPVAQQVGVPSCAALIGDPPRSSAGTPADNIGPGGKMIWTIKPDDKRP